MTTETTYKVEQLDCGLGPTGDYIVIDGDGPVSSPNRVGVWSHVHETKLDAEHGARYLNGHEPTIKEQTQMTKTKAKKTQAEKLRELAENMQSKIDDKFADRETTTPKRMRDAGNARAEGMRLQRTQDALYALAELHETGVCPEGLADIKNRKTVYELMAAETQQGGGYYDSLVDLGRPREGATEQGLMLWGLLDPDKAAEKAAEVELEAKLAGLQLSNIPGYFPTPDPVIDEMLSHVAITDDTQILEPSAGHGAIIDRIDGRGVVSAFEFNRTLSEVLEAKGVDVIGGDFLEAEPEPRFDVVLMNPPFEKSADMAHVERAFEWLRPGGQLVAIMSGATPSKSTKRATGFREWVAELDGTFAGLPDGSFSESGTGVSTVMLILEKPEAEAGAETPEATVVEMPTTGSRRPSQIARAAVPKEWGKIQSATHIGTGAYRYSCEAGGGVLIVRDAASATTMADSNDRR